MSCNRLLFLSYSLFFFGFVQCHPGHYTGRIEKLIRIVESKGQHKLEKYQKKVLSELKSKHHSQPDYGKLIPIISLFSLGNSHPLVKENRSILETSLACFKNVPGYEKTLMTFLQHLSHPETARGYLYEIQQAVAMKDAYRILAFGKIETFNKKKADFDFIALRKHDKKVFYVECKDRNFEKIRTKTKKGYDSTLCKQLLLKKAIVEAHNKRYADNASLALCSNKSLPTTWKHWLDAHDVIYSEGTQIEFKQEYTWEKDELNDHTSYTFDLIIGSVQNPETLDA